MTLFWLSLDEFMTSEYECMVSCKLMRAGHERIYDTIIKKFTLSNRCGHISVWTTVTD